MPLRGGRIPKKRGCLCRVLGERERVRKEGHLRQDVLETGDWKVLELQVG